jgi:hypothetical protein
MNRRKEGCAIALLCVGVRILGLTRERQRASRESQARASTLRKYKVSRSGIHIVPDTVLVDSNDKMTARKTARRSNG